jgi:hypothetical protein
VNALEAELREKLTATDVRLVEQTTADVPAESLQRIIDIHRRAAYDARTTRGRAMHALSLLLLQQQAERVDQ